MFPVVTFLKICIAEKTNRTIGDRWKGHLDDDRSPTPFVID